MIKPSVLCDFVDYVESFYGDGGIYDHELGFHVTRERIWSATSAHLMSLTAEGSDFEGDTVDREMVRDVMIEQHKEGVRA
jgi:hypothetical protein